MKEQFNEKEYKKKWGKDHKKQFNVSLDIDEYEEIDETLKKLNIDKVCFLRTAWEKFKEELENKNEK